VKYNLVLGKNVPKRESVDFAHYWKNRCKLFSYNGN